MQLNHTAARSARLSAVLRCDMHLSHTLVNRLKVQNAIFVNGRPAHTDYPVAAGDVVSVRIEEAEPDYPAEPGTLDILFEDEAVIALDKPSGLLMHPSHSRNTGTLANYLAHYYRESGQKCAVHPVSRLDRDTFGVVLLAKTPIPTPVSATRTPPAPSKRPTSPPCSARRRRRPASSTCRSSACSRAICAAASGTAASRP